MPISQALYTGVTGLSVNSDGMSVIANNIANANAKGFKKDRAEFEDMISLDLQSGAGSAQIGRGSRLRSVRTMHTQGGLAVTDVLTDLAVQGMGFFVLANKSSDSDESSGKFYSRVGSFIFDKDGYLSDSTGGHVQGYMVNERNQLSTRLNDIRIETNSIAPSATQNLILNVNLDARARVSGEAFDISQPEKTSNYNNTTTIYDSHGGAHQMTVFFKRLEDVDGPQWEWHATVDSKEVVDSDSQNGFTELGSGVISFDSQGRLLSEESGELFANFVGGSKQNQAINLDFGKNIGEEEGNGIGAASSIASKSVTNFHSQDGFEAGNIKSLKVDLDGVISGVYTNGVIKKLGAVALATFENQDALVKAGRNQFYSTIKSGPPKIGMAKTGTRGAIFASSLEESNVDLAQEFVQMIVTQRAFQANSRSITTTDTMIEEIINLKR